MKLTASWYPTRHSILWLYHKGFILPPSKGISFLMSAFVIQNISFPTWLEYTWGQRHLNFHVLLSCIPPWHLKVYMFNYCLLNESSVSAKSSCHSSICKSSQHWAECPLPNSYLGKETKRAQQHLSVWDPRGNSCGSYNLALSGTTLNGQTVSLAPGPIQTTQWWYAASSHPYVSTNVASHLLHRSSPLLVSVVSVLANLCD